MEPQNATSGAYDASLDNTNPFFFQQLVSLAATNDVKTTEDIYSANGIKLISKGTKINNEAYDRMISHKLAKPLESSVMVEGGITATSLAEEAQQILDNHASIRIFIGDKAKQTLEILSNLKFTPASQTLLSVYESKSESTLHHITLVALIALGITHKIQPRNTALLQTLGYASVFHDVGELYINPEIIQKKGILLPTEWKQLAAHPVIGQTILKKVEGIHEEVGKIIAEHHERLDGFGYPLGKKALSAGGQILSVAEMVSGLMNKRMLPFRHAELALKIVPGEYAKDLIDLVARARADASEEFDPMTMDATPQRELDQQMHTLFMRLANILTVYDLVQQAARHFSKEGQGLLSDIFHRFGAIQRAFSSTGLDTTGESNLLGLDESDSGFIRFEAQLVVNEIQWRLGELSRELAIRCMRLIEIEAKSMLMLSAALNGEKQEAIGSHSEANVELF